MLLLCFNWLSYQKLLRCVILFPHVQKQCLEVLLLVLKDNGTEVIRTRKNNNNMLVFLSGCQSQRK